MEPRLLAAIDKCLRHCCPFVAYAFPGMTQVRFYANPSYGREELHENGGAAISFFGRNARVVTVAAEMSADEVLKADWSGMLFRKPDITPWPDSTLPEEYTTGVSGLIDILRRRGGKTVISRTIAGRYSGAWADVVEQVFDRIDSNAFRFVYYTPETAGWAGASPELLLDMRPSGEISTMALAGTMSGDDCGEWDLKNREEHELVVEYIASVLRESGLSPVIHQAETVRHGCVRHLRHLITASGAYGKFDSIVDRLSPTPALAGWPVETSIGEIANVEAHSRYCYGGYISVTDTDGCRRAYVNLRSFHFYGNAYCIYAGGGITGRSDVDSEWREAEAKSKPLRQILGTCG